MALGKKTGGRTKGTPNKRTNALREGLQGVMELHGYDPYEALVVMASDEETPFDVRLSIHKHLLRYTYPEKAPVAGGPKGGNGGSVINLVMDGERRHHNQ